MQRVWLITNPQSGTATPEKCAAIEAATSAHGSIVVGRSAFPETALPTPAALDEAEADTVMLFAGDGTINAALCALEDWHGVFLILPGGTMNLLAKRLHDSLDPAAIIAAAQAKLETVALPFVAIGKHKAFVAVILGPAGHWFRPREALRAGRFGRLAHTVLHAWRATFRKHVRVTGVAALHGRYQAIFISPHEDRIEAAAIAAQDWRSIIALGWGWIMGDWLSTRAVTHRVAHALRTAGKRPTLALIDGEPQTLPPGTIIVGGTTTRRFISTRAER